jgi:REP element-mobilizing transposase RayT
MRSTPQSSDAPKHGPRGWHSRGYLPHFDGGVGLTQSVTFRLADSVPSSVVEGWLGEFKLNPPAMRELELRKKLDKYLDSGYGECHLRDPQIGALVENALLFFDGARYAIHAWVVMPNHIHVLFTPMPGWSLSDILSSWKSFTAKEANKELLRSGQFWHEDYFDRFIRDADHYARAIDYIERNPVEARLCGEPEHWPFGSARMRVIAQAAETAAVPGKDT